MGGLLGDGIEKAEPHAAGVEQFAPLIEDLRVEGDVLVGQPPDLGVQREQVIVVGRAHETRLQAHHWQPDAVYLLQFLVGQAQGAHSLYPPYFIELGVVAVIQITHLISLRIADTDLEVVSVHKKKRGAEWAKVQRSLCV